MGAILLIVLGVIALLGLAAWIFMATMVTEAEATSVFARSVETRMAADSGVDYGLALLNHTPESEQRTRSSQNRSGDEPFRHIPVAHGDSPQSRTMFSLLQPRLPSTLRPNGRYESPQLLRMGLLDECGKLNVNSLPHFERLDSDAGRDLLMTLPGMTQRIAAAILDWVDSNQKARPLGAESYYYSTLSPPDQPTNGPIGAIDELLRVRGVTRELLYGEDANQNGRLDPNEDDGDRSWPPDNRDGDLQFGWRTFLTVHSAESNRQTDGSPRINLNRKSLAKLYDEIEREFGREEALFVVGWRLYGPLDKVNTQRELTAQEQIEETRRRVEAQIKGRSSDDVEDEVPEDERTRGGMDLSEGGRFSFRSLVDLFGNVVRARTGTNDRVLESPWPHDAGTIVAIFPGLRRKLSVSSDPVIPGRLSVNSAPLELLAAVPGVSRQLAATIVAARQQQNESMGFFDRDQRSVAWLLYDGLLDLKQLRLIAPYITAGGDVFRTYSVGSFETGETAMGVEVVLDVSHQTPRIVASRDLEPQHTQRLMPHSMTSR